MMTTPLTQLFEQAPQSSIVVDITALNNPNYNHANQYHHSPKGTIVKKRKPWKKPVDKPKRPASAYNLFFQLERERLLHTDDHHDDDHMSCHDNMSEFYTDRHIEKIIDHQNAPKPKRKHRKSHGKIGFAELAKMIANNWKVLPEHYKALFEKHATVQKDLYVEAVALWQQQKGSSKKNGSTASAASSSAGASSIISTSSASIPTHVFTNSSCGDHHSTDSRSITPAPVSEDLHDNAAAMTTTTTASMIAEPTDDATDPLIGTTIPQGFWQTMLAKQQQQHQQQDQQQSLSSLDGIGNMMSNMTYPNEDMMTALRMMNMMNANTAAAAASSTSSDWFMNHNKRDDSITSTTESATTMGSIPNEQEIRSSSVTSAMNIRHNSSMLSLLGAMDHHASMEINHEAATTTNATPFGKVLPSCSSFNQLHGLPSSNDNLLRQLSMHRFNQWNQQNNNNHNNNNSLHNSHTNHNNNNTFRGFASTHSLFEPLNMNDSTASLTNMARQYSFLRMAMLPSSVSMNRFHTPMPSSSSNAMKNAIFEIPSSSTSTTSGPLGHTTGNSPATLPPGTTNPFQSHMMKLNNPAVTKNIFTNAATTTTTNAAPFGNHIFQDFAFRNNLQHKTTSMSTNGGDPLHSALNLLQYNSNHMNDM